MAGNVRAQRAALLLVRDLLILPDLRGIGAECAVGGDVELIHQPVAFDTPGKPVPLIGSSGVGSWPLADDVADVLRRLDDGSLDLVGDLLFAPVLELHGGGELSHEFRAVVLEPSLWVT